MHRKVAIVSLHFSPAHVSHLMAYGKLLRSMGLAVCYVLEAKYLEFADFGAVAPAIDAAQYCRDPGCVAFGAAIFYNAALANASTARKMRRRGIRVLYVFHEPVPVRMRLSEGWKEILKLIVAKFCSITMLRECSSVLVASDYGRGLYERHFRQWNPSVQTFPLLFEDEYGASTGTEMENDRPYFSFLGMAVKAHDFDGFCAFAKHAIRAGSTMQFAIATRTDLGAYLAGDKELTGYARDGRIVIQHGRMLTNEEMNRFSARSFCVWNIYTCSTQSGALVRAFMTGTPVVATRMGSFPEFIRPGVNGELLLPGDGNAVVLATVEKIRAHLPEYVAGARRTFNERFFYGANRDRLTQILKATRKDMLKCA